MSSLPSNPPDTFYLPPEPDTGSTTVEQIRNALDDLLQRKSMIALQLHQSAQNSVGSVAKQMELMSRWFDRPITANDVLSHADALAICRPLLDMPRVQAETSDQTELTGATPEGLRPAASTNDEGSPEEWVSTSSKLEDSVRRWESSISRRPSRNRFWVLLAYPIVLSITSIAILMLICVFLVPSFEEMMDDFGLALPLPTRTVFAVSRFTQTYGAWLLLGIIILVVIAAFARLLSHRAGKASPWIRLGQRLFTPTRLAWASWAEHVALLLQTGLSKADAYRIAGESSPARFMRTVSQECLASLKSGRAPLSGITHVRGKPSHLMIRALQSPSPEEQASLLREVGKLYEDRERHKRRDLLVWLTPLVVLLIGGITGWVMIALFMPLVELVSGLT
ncbi:type II secretion system F family protein [Rhodopirellula sp. JC740]|uniref:Type II secretion system F family protein n=1 Tax=Rhodopirellula halodulae TaxID=2894198 RepID=A0ABS8NK50_9BACT|nr:type II secretion system F family protein [Rhodopirellula sp. JC740]MCC9643928.1 type II secretion system F family protein [Rhodopirellula sp. JC740]